MKPTKNNFYCNDSGKPKIRFETEKEANTFLKFNADNIEAETGIKPIRSYHCISCNSWHVTSKKAPLFVKSKTEAILEIYEKHKAEIKLQKAKLEIQKVDNNKIKEEVLKETKAKREKLIELLKLLKINIELIKNLIKTENQSKCFQIFDDSFRMIDDIRITIKELELLYESKMSKDDLIIVLGQKQKK
jgi:hypothetical protein